MALVDTNFLGNLLDRPFGEILDNGLVGDYRLGQIICHMLNKSLFHSLKELSGIALSLINSRS